MEIPNGFTARREPSGFTGIIEIDGIYYVVEDGQAYYFDVSSFQTYKQRARRNY